MGDGKPAVTVTAAVEVEKYKNEKENNGQEDNEEGNLLYINILNIQYTDNLVTDTKYVLSDTAEVGKDCYTQLISRSHTLRSLMRKFMKILEFMMVFGPVTKKNE